jgi:glycerophosphoryl diester phosphodiesterase|tara:strand:- start:25 stop:759 length:735 start_codon:yes stop_codon:yes gene_type:complete
MVKVIGHRGASEDAPENTLSSVKESFKQGSDGVEIDIRLTKDNHVVCIHDKNSLRTSGEFLIISETKFNALKKLDVGSWKSKKWKNERIPLLEEVLKVIPDKKEIFIEVKTGTEIIEPLINALNRSNINLSDVSIISFNREVIKKIKSRMSEITGNLLIAFDPEVNLEQGLGDLLKSINADGVGAQNHQNLNSSLVKEVHNLRKKIHVWTVNDQEEANKFELMGINSITTNRPKLIKKSLNITK